MKPAVMVVCVKHCSYFMLLAVWVHVGHVGFAHAAESAFTLDSMTKLCQMDEKCDLTCNPDPAILASSKDEVVTRWQIMGSTVSSVVQIIHDDGKLKVDEVNPVYKDKLAVVSNSTTLRILNSQISSEGSYVCTVLRAAQVAYEKETNVTVIKLPADVTPVIEPAEPKMKADQQTNITCSLNNAYPQAELSWKIESGDASLTQQEEVITENEDHTYNTVLTALLTWGQGSSKLTCEVTHPGIPGGSQKSVGGEPSVGWILPVIIIVLLVVASGIIASLLVLYRKRTRGQADYEVKVPAQSAEEGRELKDMSKKGSSTALLDAAKNGDAAEASRILERHPNLKDGQDEEGWTALHWAAAYGHSSLVTALLEKQVTISVKNKAGETAEDLATSHKHVDIVTMLQEAATAEQERLTEA